MRQAIVYEGSAGKIEIKVAGSPSARKVSHYRKSVFAKKNEQENIMKKVPPKIEILLQN